MRKFDHDDEGRGDRRRRRDFDDNGGGRNSQWGKRGKPDGDRRDRSHGSWGKGRDDRRSPMKGNKRDRGNKDK